MTAADRGQQSRTHAWNANRDKLKITLYICTYNPQSISDLNNDLDFMLVELERIKWNVIGLSVSQIKTPLLKSYNLVISFLT